MRHELRVLPKYYEEVRTGLKNFEVRYNDRGYQVGDELLLREWNPETEEYSGRWHIEEVGYILDDSRFLKDGFVVLGFA